MEKKTSGLGIAGMILGIIGMILSIIVIGIVPCVIGLVLSIVALTQKERKHGTAIAGVACSVIGIGIFILFLFLLGGDEESTVTNPTNEVEESDLKENEIEKTENSYESVIDNGAEEEKEVNVEILKEYTLPDGINWYTRHFYIIKNNSDVTVDITTSSIAYNEEGEVVGAADSEFYALGAGCTSVFYEAFETSEKIDRYDTTMEYEPSSYYESVIQDLSYVENDVEDGAVFQVTNNGEDAAEFVEGYALFYLGEELVGYESMYFTDDDSEIKPGKTISKQMTSYDDFDRIEFYLTGRK